MNDKKPMIRHCRNCKWCEIRGVLCPVEFCAVKYEPSFYPRWDALLCRHFKMKEVKDETN